MANFPTYLILFFIQVAVDSEIAADIFEILGLSEESSDYLRLLTYLLIDEFAKIIKDQEEKFIILSPFTGILRNGILIRGGLSPTPAFMVDKSNGWTYGASVTMTHTIQTVMEGNSMITIDFVNKTIDLNNHFPEGSATRIEETCKLWFDNWDNYPEEGRLNSDALPDPFGVIHDPPPMRAPPERMITKGFQQLQSPPYLRLRDRNEPGWCHSPFPIQIGGVNVNNQWYLDFIIFGTCVRYGRHRVHLWALREGQMGANILKDEVVAMIQKRDKVKQGTFSHTHTKEGAALFGIGTKPKGLPKDKAKAKVMIDDASVPKYRRVNRGQSSVYKDYFDYAGAIRDEISIPPMDVKSSSIQETKLDKWSRDLWTHLRNIGGGVHLTTFASACNILISTALINNISKKAHGIWSHPVKIIPIRRQCGGKITVGEEDHTPYILFGYFFAGPAHPRMESQGSAFPLITMAISDVGIPENAWDYDWWACKALGKDLWVGLKSTFLRPKFAAWMATCEHALIQEASLLSYMTQPNWNKFANFQEWLEYGNNRLVCGLVSTIITLDTFLNDNWGEGAGALLSMVWQAMNAKDNGYHVYLRTIEGFNAKLGKTLHGMTAQAKYDLLLEFCDDASVLAGNWRTDFDPCDIGAIVSTIKTNLKIPPQKVEDFMASESPAWAEFCAHSGFSTVPQLLKTGRYELDDSSEEDDEDQSDDEYEMEDL